MVQSVAIPDQILMSSFSLSEEQAGIYKIFLIKGILTLGEISILSDKSHEECEKIVKDLLNLKLINALPGLVPRYKVLPPYQGLFTQVSKFQVDFERNNGELIKTTEKFVNDLKNNIQSQIKDIKDFIRRKVEDSKAFDKDKDSYVNELSKYTKELGDISTKFTEGLSKIYLEYLKTFEDRINKIKGNLDKNIAEITKEIKDVKQKSSEELNDNITKSFSSQKDNMNNLAQFVISKLNETIDGEYKLIENLGNDLTLPISKGKEGLSDYTNEFQNKIFTFFNQQIEFVNSLLLEFKDKVNPSISQEVISSLISANRSKLKSELENQQKLLSNSLNELKTSFTTNYLEKAQIALESKMKDARAILEKIVAPSKEEISKIITQNIDNFESSSSNLKKGLSETIEKVFDKIIKDYDSKIQLSLEAINRGLTSNYAETIDLVTKGNEQRSIEILREIEKIQQRLEEFKNTFMKSAENYRLSYLNILETISTNVSTNLEQFQNKSIDPINKIIDKIVFTLEDVNKENQDTTGTLRAILNEFDRLTSVDLEKTWPIVSEKVIIDYIMDMFVHSNRSIFVIIPTLSLLKLDYLKNVEPNILIHVFSYFEPQTDQGIIDNLLVYKNIRVWQINTKISLFCAFRDSKELICAPFAENKKEIVGFITEQEEYLNIFKRIIGPFFSSISNEMKLTKELPRIEELPKVQLIIKEKPQKVLKEKPQKALKEKPQKAPKEKPQKAPKEKPQKTTKEKLKKK